MLTLVLVLSGLFADSFWRALALAFAVFAFDSACTSCADLAPVLVSVLAGVVALVCVLVLTGVFDSTRFIYAAF